MAQYLVEWDVSKIIEQIAGERADSLRVLLEVGVDAFESYVKPLVVLVLYQKRYFISNKSPKAVWASLTPTSNVTSHHIIYFEE